MKREIVNKNKVASSSVTYKKFKAKPVTVQLLIVNFCHVKGSYQVNVILIIFKFI